MQVRLLVSLHISGALCLCLGSIINLLIHPLNVHYAAITIILFCLGSSLLVQELSAILCSKQTNRKKCPLDSYRNRAASFLIAGVLVFDTLFGLPCDAETVPLPFTAPSARMTIPSSSVGRNASAMLSEKSSLSYEEPPTFGTAFYLSSSLSPYCVRIDAVPRQDVRSVAWVSVSINHASLSLVLAASAAILSISIVYFVLFILNKSGKVGLSPSMSGEQQQLDDFRDHQDLEARSAISREAVKDGDRTPSGYHLHPYADDRTSRSRSVDVFEENALEVADEIECVGMVSPISDAMSGKPSSIASAHHLGSLAPDCALSPTHGTASTPEQALRSQRSKRSQIMLDASRAGSEPYLRCSVSMAQRQRQYGYAYDCGYNRTVDFASGCIMHYPLFPQKKKKRPASPAKGFATLSPPDFSRSSGLTPRAKGKARVTASSRSIASTSASQRETESDAQGQAEEAEPAVSVTTGSVETLNDTAPRHSSANDRVSPTNEADHIQGARLGTSDSTSSALSILTASRPGTTTPTHSARQRRALLAPLELNHLHSRLSGISVDAAASRSSCDSHRSCCSTGTFGGDGITQDEPPVTTATRRRSLPHA